MNSLYTTDFITSREISITILNINLHFISHEELWSHFLYIMFLYTAVFMRNLHIIYLYRSYYISYCLHAGLVQLHLIQQAHYINNTASHNNPHSIHKTNVISDPSLTWNARIITSITLRVLHNLLTQRRPLVLSYFCIMWYGIYHTPKTTIPYETPLNFMTSFSIQMHWNCVLQCRHQIIWYRSVPKETNASICTELPLYAR
jgi:hypothetical protein